MNWEHLLDKYGWPTLAFALLLAGVWYVGTRWIQPAIVRFLDMIETQLSESRAARLNDQKEFLAELRAQREAGEASARAFSDALRVIESSRGRK